jgi:hypothetical protein
MSTDTPQCDFVQGNSVNGQGCPLQCIRHRGHAGGHMLADQWPFSGRTPREENGP